MKLFRCFTAAILIFAILISVPVTAYAAEGGGHQVSGGGSGGDESDQRPTNDPTENTTIITNDDGSRTLTVSQKVTVTFEKNDAVLKSFYSFKVTGKGKFVIVSFMDNAHSGGDDGIGCTSFILSNETFSNHMYDENTDFGDRGCAKYNGAYYSSLSGLVSYNPLSSLKLVNFPNMKNVTVPDGETFLDILKRYIDSGELDLTNDDWEVSRRPTGDDDHEGGGYLIGIKISPLTDDDSCVTYGKDNIVRIKIDTDNSYIVVSDYSSTITWAGVPIDKVIYSGSTAILYIVDYASPKTYTLTAIYDDGTRRFSSNMDFVILDDTSDSGGGGTGGGDTGGDDTGGDDTGGGNTGGDDTGGDDTPDFDLDFSNIFTLIYSIIKALIDFITFALNMLIEFSKLLFEQVGQFSSLIGGVFSFLPEEFITMLLSGITIMVIMGIIKR